MSKSFHISLVIKGVFIATISAIVFSLVFGVLLSYTSLPESPLASSIIFGVSVFIASFITAYQAGTRGLYYGLSVGIGAVLLVLLLSAILWTDTPSWLKIAEKTIIALATGGLGGIIGVVFPQA